MMILNLTQHAASQAQLNNGVIEPVDKDQVQKLITFDTIPTCSEMRFRAKALAQIAKESGASAAMIGGAPYFMSTLESALMNVHIEPVYAFSVRESQEVTQPDGSVQKVSVFKHAGFVRPCFY
jgi:hypothetical protein